MTPVTQIAVRATACGVVACSLLAYASARIDAAQLMADLHHHPLMFHEGWVQFAIIAVGIVLAYMLCKGALLQLDQQGGRKRLWGGIAETFGFFALGFMLVGMFLPSHA